MTPFDFVNAVTFTKKNLIQDDPECVKAYVPFIINKALSYHLDTLLDANTMNLNAHVAADLQFAFYLHSLRKARRFSKWAKPDESEELKAVAQFFRFGPEKAKQALAILAPEQVKLIKAKMAARGDENVRTRKHG